MPTQISDQDNVFTKTPEKQSISTLTPQSTPPLEKDTNKNNNESSSSITATTTITTPNSEQKEETDQIDKSIDQTRDAIESNEDYQAVTKVLNVLKHQLNRATKDIETLTQLKKDAMEDPFGFVLDLKSKKKLKRAPRLQKVLSVPELDWTKYRFMPESRFAKQAASLAALTQQYTNAYNRSGMYKTILDTPMTSDRPINKSTQRNTSAEVKELQRELAKGMEAVGQIPSRAGSAAVSEASDSDDDQPSGYPNGKGKRRVSSQTGMAGKYTPVGLSSSSSTLERSSSPCDGSSSSSSNKIQSEIPEHELPNFNAPWTDEEQRHLEQLLEIYPDEPVQAQRFNKIAKALGTRTPRQVASRIQKYFIKLNKMGLPIPGRLNLSSTTSSSGTKGTRGGRSRIRGRRSKIKGVSSRQRTSGMGYNSIISGGLTHHKVSGGYYSSAVLPTVYMSDDEQVDDKVKQTMLRVAKPTSDNDLSTSGTETVIHEGFACDSCSVEPIVGVLYKCTVCDETEEVDLCSKCMAIGTFTNDQHTADHTFEAIRTAAPPYYADNDYASPEHLGEYSYLGF
ncbi:uncharacterized protein BX664DRAFT_389501 [Halteromyces radiatus]|uniref:uncharacterized protein n=1 Tax=Halteromyces radiatus TaxID=101107 RepID=UPI00221F274C|nr:uncharacterized protein BX664DRAFT_389501 [Halteromyces radiatus]KAI8076766.1 hypothetical protein BX664DRAFT_389501 [Halteromyces radiatus]